MAFSGESLNIKKSHPYMTFGVYAPVPVPMVGIGYRDLQNNRGTDFSIDLGSVVVGTFVNAHVKYITYFSNNYIAIGAKGSFVIAVYNGRSASAINFAPEITFGKDRKTTFNQINLNFPHVMLRDGISYIPVISYQYGVKF